MTESDDSVFFLEVSGGEIDTVDTVDTGSGNITVGVLIGQVYEVGGKLAYQFQAVHNSTAGDSVTLCPEDGCQPPIIPRSVFAMPNPGSNAGLGWELKRVGQRMVSLMQRGYSQRASRASTTCHERPTRSIGITSREPAGPFRNMVIARKVRFRE